VVAGDRFQRGPTDQPRAHLGDRPADDFGVGLAMTRGESSPRAQRLSGAEAVHVADLGDEDRCDGAPDQGQALLRVDRVSG